MVNNARQGYLPEDIEDYWEVTRPLVVDFYLRRGHIVSNIAHHVRQVHPSETGDAFTHKQAAHLLHHALDHDESNSHLVKYARGGVDAGPVELHRAYEKYEIIARLGALYRFRAANSQTRLSKSQLVHILIVEETGDVPGHYTLPSEVDPVETESDWNPQPVRAGGD